MDLRVMSVTPASWTTYASLVTPFLEYIEAEGVPLLRTGPDDVQAWIATLISPAELTGPIWSPATLGQAVSAIRKVMAAVGVTFPPAKDDWGTRTALQAYEQLWHAAGLNTSAAKIPLDADHVSRVLEKALECVAVALAGELLSPADHRALVRAAHTVLAFTTFARNDTTRVSRVCDLRPTPTGVEFEFTKLKRRRSAPPVQQYDRSPHKIDPVDFLRQYREYVLKNGYSTRSFLFGPSPSLPARPLQADMLDSLAWAGLDRQAGLTGHSPRVGASSAANAIHVPLHAISERLIHANTNSTLAYIRSFVRPSRGAVIFFGNQSPVVNTAAVSVYSARLEGKRGQV
jgi:hypothetical protein